MMMMTNELWQAHEEEGKRIARQHGFETTAVGLDWVYYNSDFYFFEKEMRLLIFDIGQESLDGRGVDSDLREWWDQRLGHSRGSSDAVTFNLRWGDTLSYARQRGYYGSLSLRSGISGSLRDITMSPPRGFSFFFGDQIRTPMAEIRRGEMAPTGPTVHRQVLILNKQTIVKENGEFTSEHRVNLADFLKNHSIDDGSVLGFLKNFDIIRNALGNQWVNPYQRMLDMF